MTVPVATWLPLFSHFTDAQILNPGYALHLNASGATWCKLCDAPIHGETGDAHLSRHARDLAAHRKKQRAETAKNRERTLAQARQARAAA